ncbi:MAG: ribosome small subunit-dependent GTPase A [Clostridia bacterium]|nr:ribosome small subunit-dependent GTPase A [Clostridia bacterium]
MEGIILKGIGGFYTVRDHKGDTYTLRAQSKLRRNRLTPMIGDLVEFQIGEYEDENWLSDIKPRKNSLIRPPVANIDKLVVTIAASTPKADLLLVDRLLLLCADNDIEPVIVINKSDQDEQSAREIEGQYSSAAKVFVVCALSGENVDELKRYLRGCVHAFAGQSGVGKSSIINALYGLSLETGGLSKKIDRGKNTTRRAELIPVDDGGMVLDTPGFSLLETDLIEPVKLKTLVAEFKPYEGQCRFEPCMHYKEPDCAVRTAVSQGRISAGRYERYQTLFEDMRERWKNRYD